MTDEPNPPTATAYAVSLKLPDFWPSDPELWFAQAEALFTAQNITQEKTKFGHVVRVLPARYASEVRDIILRPPEQPYKNLKAELTKRVCPSKRQRLQQLLHVEDLGDRKPSQLLRYMLKLRGDAVLDADRDEIFRELFLQKLPITIRPSVNAAHTTGSSQLLRVFDKNSKLHFLIDTGAEISVFPAGRADRFHKSDVTLRAANNSTINTYGFRQLTLDFGLPRPLTWKFVVADLNQSIVDADFLLRHKLLVDLEKRRLLDTRNGTRVEAALHQASLHASILSLRHRP